MMHDNGITSCPQCEGRLLENGELHAENRRLRAENRDLVTEVSVRTDERDGFEGMWKEVRAAIERKDKALEKATNGLRSIIELDHHCHYDDEAKYVALARSILAAIDAALGNVREEKS